MLEGIITWQGKSAEYISLLEDGLLGWSLFVTKRGHCGIALNGSQVGDVYCISSGDAVPQRAARDGLFGLVGTCYVEGMMGGKALRFEGVRREMIRIL